MKDLSIYHWQMIVKKIVTIFIAVLLIFTIAIDVSADSQTLTSRGFGSGFCDLSENYQDKYDIYAYISNSSSFIVNANNYTENNSGFVYWEFDINQDYTYTCSFQATFSSSSPFHKNAFKPFDGNPVFFSNKQVPAGSSVYFEENTILSFADFTKVSDTKYNVKVTVTFNPTLSNIALDHIAIYYPFFFGFKSETTVSVSKFSYTCTYDPGGNNLQKDYSEYFQQIITAGNGYPIPDGTSLDSSVSSIITAEGILTDKSKSLKDSVSSELTNNISTAKSLVNTLKPASIQINNLYNTFLTALPNEVKAIFIAIPLLLFIGWLIGRIKE